MWTCRPSVHTVRRPPAGPRFEPWSGGLEPGTLTSRPPHLSVDHCTYCILKKRLLYLLPGWAIVDRVFWDGGGVGHVGHVARLRDHVVLHLQKKAVVTRKNPLYKFRKKCFVCISTTIVISYMYHKVFYVQCVTIINGCENALALIKAAISAIKLWQKMEHTQSRGQEERLQCFDIPDLGEP